MGQATCKTTDAMGLDLGQRCMLTMCICVQAIMGGIVCFAHGLVSARSLVLQLPLSTCSSADLSIIATLKNKSEPDNGIPKNVCSSAHILFFPPLSILSIKRSLLQRSRS